MFDEELWNSLLDFDGYEQRLSDYDLQHADDTVVVDGVPRKSHSHDAVRNAKHLFKDFLGEDYDPEEDRFIPDLDDSSVSSSDSSVSEGEQDSPFSSILPETSAPEGVSPSEEIEPEDDLTPEVPTTRSGRRIKPVDRLMYNVLMPGKTHPLKEKTRYNRFFRESYLAGSKANKKIRCAGLQEADLHGIKWDPSTFLTSGRADTRRAMAHLLRQQADGYGWDPLALAAKGEDPEFNPTYEQAMNGPLKKGYEEATQKEIETLKAMDVWEVVDREVWMNVLPSVWAFKKKVYPDGSVRKLKGRFCVGGHRQVHGVDYWSTF